MKQVSFKKWILSVQCYGGSGPADFALNILSAYIGEQEARKDGLYQDFKWEFVAKLPKEGGTIKREYVFHWLEDKRREHNEI